jgi:pimeloyl-ACP methyl ester carboxylesterase
MAVSIAAAYPGRCIGVITESAQEFVEDRTLEGIRVAGEQFKDPAQLDRLKRYHGEKAQWVLDAWVQTWQSPEFADWNLDALLPQVTVPLLAIHGENDEYGSMRHPEKLVALAGGPADMLPMPGCGHVPHREREDAVLDAVRRFLGQRGV